EVHSNAQYDVAIVGLTAVRRSHVPLQIDGALHRINSAGELHKYAVTSGFEDSSLMLGEQGVQHVAPPGLEGVQRARLVGLHQSAVPDYIGGQNYRKSALYFGHSARLPPESPVPANSNSHRWGRLLGVIAAMGHPETPCRFHGMSGCRPKAEECLAVA